MRTLLVAAFLIAWIVVVGWLLVQGLAKLDRAFESWLDRREKQERSEP